VHDPRPANGAFTALTLLANAALIGLVVVCLASLVSPGGRRLAARVVARVGGAARGLAFAVAATATLGSLYYSEVVGFVPCELCWYQRICMYPLAVILLVGLVRRDRSGAWYAWPFVVIGAPVSLYHWLVERVPAFAESTSCSVSAPCTVPYFEELGYVTLSFMAMSAFLLIGALLVTDRAAARTTDRPTAEEHG
jgi:disulfide bond formation protein DsbB